MIFVAFMIQLIFFVSYEDFDPVKSTFDTILNRFDETSTNTWSADIEYLVTPAYAFFSGIEPFIMMVAWLKVVFQPVQCQCDVKVMHYRQFEPSFALLATPVQVMLIFLFKLNIYAALENLRKRKWVLVFSSLLRPDFLLVHIFYFVFQFWWFWISFITCVPFCILKREYHSVNTVMKDSHKRLTLRVTNSLVTPEGHLRVSRNRKKRLQGVVPGSEGEGSKGRRGSKMNVVQISPQPNSDNENSQKRSGTNSNENAHSSGDRKHVSGHHSDTSEQDVHRRRGSGSNIHAAHVTGTGKQSSDEQNKQRSHHSADHNHQSGHSPHTKRRSSSGTVAAELSSEQYSSVHLNKANNFSATNDVKLTEYEDGVPVSEL